MLLTFLKIVAEGEREREVGRNVCVYLFPGIFRAFPRYSSLTFSFLPPSSMSHHIAFSSWGLRVLVLVVNIEPLLNDGRSSYCISLDLLSEGKCKRSLGNCISLWLLFPCREIKMNPIIFPLKSSFLVMLDGVYGSHYSAFWRSIHLNKFSHCY